MSDATARHGTPRDSTRARDAALARLRRVNRSIIAGTLVATAVLTDVVANAFAGRTIHNAAAVGAPAVAVSAGTSAAKHSVHARRARPRLRPPAAAPAPLHQAPVQQPAPVQQAPVQQAPVQQAPVVSGGS